MFTLLRNLVLILLFVAMMWLIPTLGFGGLIGMILGGVGFITVNLSWVVKAAVSQDREWLERCAEKLEPLRYSSSNQDRDFLETLEKYLGRQ